MDVLERIIELGQQIATLRARRAAVAEELAEVDLRLDKVMVEIKKYVPNIAVPNLTGGNGNGNGVDQTTTTEARTRRGGPTGYKRNSVSHRILLALAAAPEGKTGAELSATLGVENRQIHSMLWRLIQATHATKGDEKGSPYLITEAGQAALANVREGGSDEPEATASND
jgi:hypothetical protein